jgi:S-DNA-T family DNA segregation ATPase FtsK/SpoIIIE
MARKKSRKAARASLLGPDQQRDLLAVALLALAVFLLVSLLPIAWLPERAGEWFPSGNVMGALGGAVRTLLVSGLGIGAPLVPALLGLSGLRVGDWIRPERAIRLALLSLGLMLLLPVGFELGLPDSGLGGGLGMTLATPLLAALGWLGGLFLVGVLLVGLLVVTLGWNPLRTVARGATRGGELVGRGVSAAGGGLRGLRTWYGERPRPAGDARRLPGVLPEEKWTGPESGGDEAAVASATAAVEPAPAPADVPVGSAQASPRKRRERQPAADDLPDPAHPRDLEGGELPPLTLLQEGPSVSGTHMEHELEQLGLVLVEKLRTFNVDCELAGRTTGPVVTQYEVVPAPGVKVNRIANLDADLALAMRAQSIRIVAPIPGKGAVGVEIPNPESATVHLRDILESRPYSAARGSLPIALGKDLTGHPYVADLAKMPHLLIAGATGSGKSVCVNTIITSLVYRRTPGTLRLLMIDPKMVELSAYTDLPHLRHQVVTDPADAAGVLKWAVLEMERRYQLLSANGVRSISEFNERVKRGTVLRRAEAEGDEGDEDRWIYDDGPLPFIVVVVDELADLMMQVQSEVEKPLAQLAQKARAIGIHLIVATQRPSVNVITGLIKANFPTRIAFRVASKTDSRTILDMNGAEALLGNGDMLFLPPGQSEPVRIQGAYISTEETDGMLSWYRARIAERVAEEGRDALERDEPDILKELREHESDEASSFVDEIAGDWDDLFRVAAEVCVSQQQGSTSLLQRRLKIGYGRAARIVDQLHDAGVLGPPDGSKPRDVLVSMSELDQICGPGS